MQEDRARGFQGAPDPTDLGARVLRAAWRFRWLVALMVVVAVAAGVALSLQQPTRYEATASIILADPSGPGVPDEASFTVDRAKQIDVIESAPVAERAAERLDGQVGPGKVRSAVAATPGQRSSVIKVTAKAGTAANAANLADATAEAYREKSAEEIDARVETTIEELDRARAEAQQRVRQLEERLRADPDDSALTARLSSATSRLASLDGRIQQLTIEASLFGSVVETVESARPPERPAQPRPARNGALAGLLGLVAALGLAVWRDERTQAADREGEAVAVLDAPLLGAVPEYRNRRDTSMLSVAEEPGSAAAESYQFVAASLEIALAEHGGGSTVVVTSPGPTDGKSQTAMNVAAAALHEGRDVLLVDADGRRRGLSHLSPCAADPGLTDAPDPSVPVQGCIAEWRVGERLRLPFLPAGTPIDDPASFYRSPAFRNVFSQLRERASLVVVDTPPMLAVADTSALAAQVDGLVVVVDRGTPLRVLQELRRRLDFVGTPVLGCVFNRARPNRSRYGYGYWYGTDGAGSRNGHGGGYGAGSRNGDGGHRRIRKPGGHRETARRGDHAARS